MPMLNAPLVTLAIGLPSGSEWIILLVLGLLIFGRRLPEVGRSIGKSIVEFKKGIKGIEDEVETASNAPARMPQDRLPDRTVDDAARRVGSETRADVERAG